MRIAHLSAASSVEEIVDEIHRSGAVVVDGLASHDTCDRVSSELAETIEATIPGGIRDKHPFMDAFFGRATKRFTGLAAKSPTFVSEVLLDPTLLAFAAAMLSSTAESFILNTAQAMIVGPGQPAQILHRDQSNWLPYAPPAGLEIEVSSMWALTDFTQANGATIVVPESNHWSPEKQPDDPDQAHATMTRGSVLLYTGSVLHGAGANTTGDWRFGLHVSFVAGWLRPEENHFLTVPAGVAADLPARARALLGYESYGTFARLGLIDFEPVAVDAQ
jgi:ectoine hydroxylase-related dioxygenase (phytanoyl-CoA dioxygenase family)